MNTCMQVCRSVVTPSTVVYESPIDAPLPPLPPLAAPRAYCSEREQRLLQLVSLLNLAVTPSVFAYIHKWQVGAA